MSCERQTAKVLKDSGHRLTPQRLSILTVLRHGKCHMTAGQILEQVRESYPYIDASTVYRTLSVAKGMRLVSEIDIGCEEHVYEWLQEERHHHLICRECGKVARLDHKHFLSLDAALLEDHGFQADLDHLAISGLCQECRRKSEQPGSDFRGSQPFARSQRTRKAASVI